MSSNTTPTTKKSEVNPSDMMAEHRLLNALVCNPEFLTDTRVNKELFNTNISKNIFTAIENIIQKKYVMSRDTLVQEYCTIDLIDGNPDIIDTHIYNQGFNEVESIDDMVDQLIDCKKRRQVVAAFDKAIEIIKDNGRLTDTVVEEIKSLIDSSETALSNIENDDIKKVYNVDEWFSKSLKEREDRKTNRPKFYNFIMDELINDGPEPGSIGIISAASGSGKSCLCLNVMSSCVEHDIPAMYFSLEMSSITTFNRLVSSKTSIPYSEVNSNKPEEWDSVHNKIKELYEAEFKDKKRFRFCENADLSLIDIKKHIKKFQSEIGQSYCIIAIDLLSMVKDFTKQISGYNMSQAIEVGINQCSMMAKELGVHILGVLQLNRASETEKANSPADLDKFKPNRAHIKNAHAFVERSRYVITTFRPKYYADMFQIEYDEPDIMTVSVVKQNNGPLKSMRAMFDGETFSLTAIENTLEVENSQTENE